MLATISYHLGNKIAQIIRKHITAVEESDSPAVGNEKNRDVTYIPVSFWDPKKSIFYMPKLSFSSILIF
jgi:hypothetical protein